MERTATALRGVRTAIACREQVRIDFIDVDKQAAYGGRASFRGDRR
jgi:hypothetical protein